jgi:hypothetical protein
LRSFLLLDLLAKDFFARGVGSVAYDFLYSLCCLPCANGIMMKSTGMPFWFGACCVSSFGGNTALRYHNRSGTYCMDENTIDCCIPGFLVCINNCAYGATAPAGALCYTFANLVEENNRHNRECGYGCNIIKCLGECCTWTTTCTCSAPEGRYLVASVPDIL